MKPKIAVLIPTRGTLFTAAIHAVIREIAGYDNKIFFTTNLPIPDCRNDLLKRAKKIGGFTHYLMVDDDVIMPEGGLQAMLDLKKPVTLIDYPTHWTGKHAGMGNVAYVQWKEGEPLRGEIMWAGLGCTLVEASVFDQFGEDPFRTGGQFFDVLPNGKKILYGVRQGSGGEDFEFYTDLREKGIEIAQVEGISCGHAKVLRHIGVIEEGKYAKQHDIHVSEGITRPHK